MLTLLISAVMASTAGAGPASKVDVDAKWWFNNPPYRLHDKRCVVLFFFDCRQRESQRWVRHLNRTARNRDVLVIGLTDGGRESAEKFIADNHVRFTVGAGSRSASTFGVRRLPALIWIDPDDRTRSTPVDFEQVRERISSARSHAGGATAPEDQDEAGLKDIIAGDAPGPDRRAAVQMLWERFGMHQPHAFVEYAREQMGEEPDPWVRGALRYYSDLAQGLPRHDRASSDSNQLFAQYGANRDSPQWAAVRAFETNQATLAPPALLEAYRKHATAAPVDVLIRRSVIKELGRRKDTEPNRVAARAALMEILRSEPDRSNRLFAVGSLGDVCKTGDQEAADLLAELARNETYVLNVRPAMEYTSYYIRTGIDDTRFFEPNP